MTHTHTHTHAHTHTLIHTYTHIHTGTDTHPLTHTDTDTHARTHARRRHTPNRKLHPEQLLLHRLTRNSALTSRGPLVPATGRDQQLSVHPPEAKQRCASSGTRRQPARRGTADGAWRDRPPDGDAARALGRRLGPGPRGRRPGLRRLPRPPLRLRPPQGKVTDSSHSPSPFVSRWRPPELGRLVLTVETLARKIKCCCFEAGRLAQIDQHPEEDATSSRSHPAVKLVDIS